MNKIFRYILLLMLTGATLACGVLTPISQVKNLAGTAEAMATANPLETLQALPSAIPDVSQYMNPTGQPVSEWKNLPIMSEASVGQEFNSHVYAFKVSSTVDEVQKFYKDSLLPLGWTQPFSAQGGTEGGVMFFTNDTGILTITISPSDNNDLVVVLFTE